MSIDVILALALFAALALLAVWHWERGAVDDSEPTLNTRGDED